MEHGRTFRLSLLQNHAQIEFAHPLGGVEGGVEVEPVAGARVGIYAWVCVTETSEGEPVLVGVEDEG